jgi:hypothetical protein
VLELADVVGRKRSEPRPAAPEAWAAAEQRNLAIARRRRELAGRLTAEIAADGTIGQLRWYVLTVTPGCERIAAAHLAARRFGIYLPTLFEMASSRGAWRLRQRPILPGYLFVSSIGLVHLSPGDDGEPRTVGRWRRAQACPGVVAFVNRAGTDEPAAIAERFIDEVRAYEAEENARFEHIHGRSFDAPPAKARNRAGNRRARERAKKREKERRRRLRDAAAKKDSP